MRSRVTQRQIASRIANRLEQDLRQTLRHWCAETVAIASHVFDGDVPLFTGDGQRDDARDALEIGGRSARVRQRAPRLDLVDREIADAEEEVVDTVRCAGVMRGVELLKLTLDRIDGCRVEELAQLGVGEQFAQLRLGG